MLPSHHCGYVFCAVGGTCYCGSLTSIETVFIVEGVPLWRVCPCENCLNVILFTHTPVYLVMHGAQHSALNLPLLNVVILVKHLLIHILDSVDILPCPNFLVMIFILPIQLHWFGVDLTQSPQTITTYWWEIFNGLHTSDGHGGTKNAIVHTLLETWGFPWCCHGLA